MAVQIIVLALVFYLGYQYALTRKPSQVTNHNQPPSENSENSPTKSNGSDQQRKNKKQKQKKKKPKNQSADPAPKPKQSSAELSNPPAGPDEPEEPDNSLKDFKKLDESDSPPHSPSPDAADEWESARRTDSTRAAKRASSAAVSVHPTRWERLDSNENLDQDLNPTPVQPRVLRIGTPVGPPRQDPPRIRYDHTSETKQLTKSQRQTQRKMQKRREERAEAAAIQEHRLRQHRIQLEETRSREQWEKAKRAKAKQQQQQGSHGSKATAGPSFIDGKLIWD
ncbi:hypothetical protein IWW48_001741 [Coemansia sp. RSA 1200]|nr:hypothetical protein IWW48_001741 [Coemansia sp. RSA 1200]